LINSGLLALDDLNARQLGEFNTYLTAMRVKQEMNNKQGDLEA